MEAVFQPIGVVVKGLPKEAPRPRSKLEVESVIEVYEDYVPGLRGLEEYSHAIIVYQLNEVKGYKLSARPWGRSDMPEVGVFASRSPYRPNPIGLTVVEIMEVEPPRLVVRGLDAWEGTPVLDIKPYNYYDIVRCPRVPEWFVR